MKLTISYQQMNRFWVLPASLLLFFLYSCIGEDNSDCFTGDQNNVILHFNYTNPDGGEEFPSKITRVDLMLFSETGYYLERWSITEEELQDFQGLKLNLDPGIYYAIEWGNLSGRSTFSALDSTTTFQSARLYLSSASTGDSLYYAPKKTAVSSSNYEIYEIVVPEKGTVEKNIEFMSAYYTVNVSVEGLSDPIKGTNQAPTITLNNVPQGYNFHLAPGEYNSTLRQTAVFSETSETEVSKASFHTTHFDVENPIEIDIIKRTTGETAYTVNLQEILLANRYILTIGKHVYIDVYVTFQADGNVEVTLSLTEWGNNPIEPF